MPKAMLGSEIREAFLSYFERKGHTRVASSKIFPEQDPTLLFTNAGMVQFKDVFLGIDKRPYSKATSCQKCIRAGGKHNDLENVGFTERHHTFFEMLGNFSFGDYFKKDAIHFAWEFVTKDLGLPKDKLRVTVFRDDDESADIWHKQEGLPLDRIIRCGEADNFWAMGDEGPCGPCSEIFWDQGHDVDGERWLEFWNVVFMQYDRKKDGTLSPLKKPSVDTGMGLERMSAVMQGVESNYQVDLLSGLLEFTHEYFESKLKKKITLSSRENLCALRVIVDHLRSTSFIIADGIQPANDGRGYVLRRILRRAVRFGHKLGMEEPFLGQLYPALVRSLGGFYPELTAREDVVREVLRQEEERFFETLGRGMGLLEDAIAKSSGQQISPAAVFQLYDTFGFPFDLTQLIAKERNLSVDMPQVEKLLEKQQAQSRASWKGSGASALPPEVREWKSSLKTTPVFYDESETSANVVGVHNLADGAWIAVDPCPFYGEGGGQVGDSGQLVDKSGKTFQVETCKKLGDNFLVLKLSAPTTLSVGDEVTAQVDDTRRTAIRSNHTATHLLHAALRNTLGTHVHQAGSFLDDSRLRFDFSHGKAVSRSELESIETWVNQSIANAQPVRIDLKTQKEALAAGAMALFGEKYGDTVRVVAIGADGKNISLELCGGLHTQNTRDLQQFKILKEEGVAAGTRRIEALSGDSLMKHLVEKEKQFDRVAQLLQVSTEQVETKIEKILAENQQLEKKIKDLEKKLLSGDSSASEKWESQFANQKLTVHILQEASIPALREAADGFRNSSRDSAHLLIAGLNVIVTADPSIKFNSGDFLKKFVSHWQGRGGGNDRLAQGTITQALQRSEIEKWFKTNAG